MCSLLLLLLSKTVKMVIFEMTVSNPTVKKDSSLDVRYFSKEEISYLSC